MEEIGVVKEIINSSVRIELHRTPQCERCGMCISAPDNKTLLLDVENTLHAQPGDQVRIALSGGSIITASFWVYGVPVIGLIGGSIIGTSVDFLGKSTPLVCGFAGLCMGVLIAMYVDRKAKESGRYNPKIIEIV